MVALSLLGAALMERAILATSSLVSCFLSRSLSLSGIVAFDALYLQ